ncbi:MAG: hypothetical protein EHM49_08885, partial [Deltaproteobacteria bacterium]
MTYEEAIKAGGKEVGQSAYNQALQSGGVDITNGQAQATIPQEQPSMIGETISNIPSSTINLLKSTIHPILHPKETAQGLYNLATLDDKTWSNVADYYKNRYGGWENVEQTIRKDPVGFATDVASVLSIGGGLAKGVGKVSQISGMPLKSAETAGKFLQKAGKVTDPFQAIG